MCGILRDNGQRVTVLVGNFCKETLSERHLNGIVTRDATIALRWDEIGVQRLADHAVANQDFHGGFEISLERKVQDMEICYTNRSRLFL